MIDGKRTWLGVFVTLLVLLPGLPYVIMLFGIVLKLFNLSGILFVPALLLHNLYFSVPALLFGERFYPAEEFGYFPSATGYAVAAVLYGVLAFGLSFPVTIGIRRKKSKKTIG